MSTASCIGSNFPEAHARLAVLLEKRLGDAESAREHRRLARQMRSKRQPSRQVWNLPHAGAAASAVAAVASEEQMPPVAECLVVVTGLPRSGTSMFMQMLAAGGMSVLTDGRREPDEDNPRGYLEFEPVKNLLKDATWLLGGRGKAVKIVAPLLGALPPGLPCRIILIERDLEEVLDSQERMLVRRKQPLPATPQRRKLLRDEYGRALARVKAALAKRSSTELLVVEHRAAIADARGMAEKVNDFLGGGLDVAKMAAAIDPALHRNRVA